MSCLDGGRQLSCLTIIEIDLSSGLDVPDNSNRDENGRHNDERRPEAGWSTWGLEEEDYLCLGGGM
jgi:hypothetical protein